MSNQSNVERTLYGFWLSPYMSQVAHMLSETGLTYRYERVSPFQGSTLTPEHMERNPLGKIPTLRDVNGVDIAESHVICRYLGSTQKHESFILLMIRCSVHRSMPRMTSSLSPLQVHSSTGLL